MNGYLDSGIQAWYLSVIPTCKHSSRSYENLVHNVLVLIFEPLMFVLDTAFTKIKDYSIYSI
jgi:hypothetical protein